MFSMNTRALMHAATWPFRWRGKTYINPNAKDESDIVIYCLNGTMDGPGAFDFLMSEILPYLPPAVKAVRLVSLAQRMHGIGIDDYARQYPEIIKNNGDTKIILVGHSRGVLVNAYFAVFLAKLIAELEESGLNDPAKLDLAKWMANLEILGCIDLAGPYLGSYLAEFFSWCSISVDQMTPDHPFSQILVEAMMKSDIKRFFHVPKKDGITDPKSTYITDLPNSSVTTYEYECHMSIMRSRECARNMLDQIWDCCQPFMPRPVLKDSDLEFEMVEKPSFDEKPEDEIEKDFFNVGDTLAERIMHDIDTQIAVFTKDESEENQSKVSLLLTLKQTVLEVLFDKGPLYTEAATVGDFMQAFFENENAMPQPSSPGMFPPVSAWSAAVNELIDQYKDTLFPFHQKPKVMPERGMGF